MLFDRSDDALLLSGWRKWDLKTGKELRGHAQLPRCSLHREPGIDSEALSEQKMQQVGSYQAVFRTQDVKLGCSSSYAVPESLGKSSLTVLHAWRNLGVENVALLKPRVTFANLPPRPYTGSVESARTRFNCSH